MDPSGSRRAWTTENDIKFVHVTWKERKRSFFPLFYQHNPSIIATSRRLLQTFDTFSTRGKIHDKLSYGLNNKIPRENSVGGARMPR